MRACWLVHVVGVTRRAAAWHALEPSRVPSLPPPLPSPIQAAMRAQLLAEQLRRGGEGSIEFLLGVRGPGQVRPPSQLCLGPASAVLGGGTGCIGVICTGLGSIPCNPGACSCLYGWLAHLRAPGGPARMMRLGALLTPCALRAYTPTRVLQSKFESLGASPRNGSLCHHAPLHAP
jgi:hypothetical protein